MTEKHWLHTQLIHTVKAVALEFLFVCSFCAKCVISVQHVIVTDYLVDTVLTLSTHNFWSNVYSQWKRSVFPTNLCSLSYHFSGFLV